MAGTSGKRRARSGRSADPTARLVARIRDEVLPVLLAALQDGSGPAAPASLGRLFQDACAIVLGLLVRLLHPTAVPGAGAFGADLTRLADEVARAAGPLAAAREVRLAERYGADSVALWRRYGAAGAERVSGGDLLGQSGDGMASPPGRALSDRAFAGVLDRLAREVEPGTGRLLPVDFARFDARLPGSLHEALSECRLEVSDGAAEGARLGFVLTRTSPARRQAGRYYTPPELVATVVDRVLGPALTAHLASVASAWRGDDGAADGGDAGARRGAGEVATGGGPPWLDRLLDFRVLDPAMGAGYFLVGAWDYLVARLGAFLDEHAGDLPAGCRAAWSALPGLVLSRCLYGVDLDPLAVRLARANLRLHGARAGWGGDAAGHLRVGNALIGRVTSGDVAATPAGDRGDANGPARGAASAPAGCAFHWDREFPEVWSERGKSARARPGFDVIVGNPPWISYAGRAAQPLDDQLRAWYAQEYEAFAGYRNLQGLFVERAARLLAPGGRLGLLVPSSMAELAGYAPTRRALARYAVCDDELPDLGDGGFDRVFQPCMVLIATRREQPLGALPPDRPWPLERPDLTAADRALLARLARLPKLPGHLFGERGMQTTRADRGRFGPPAAIPGGVPLREGGDIGSFRLGPPSCRADAAWFGGRLRDPAEWARVAVLIRQTAPVPIAVRSDGQGFRNSLLAGFEAPGWPADFLVAWLNSTPVRWWHLVSCRDARHGMPQVKIGHLRALPAPASAALIAPLAEVGATLAAAAGRDSAARARLDTLAAEALGLAPEELERMAARLARLGNLP